ncbi:PTS sugar transporter subunit IIA [Melghirimyces algeriensis]|uniref:PTS system D-mannose-specific IIA component, Fru family n=1 Tax=Melghirimyces algeriensis TaxID=910412 RepID=A0A521DA11_9BACL|nr:PTS sugar transporter subunit IIA [Melghirimyces algeriensis]SMO68537.1 PTS system D-mannose-specific IIA component, Fru family [Melghirimyces algeriensis]
MKLHEMIQKNWIQLDRSAQSREEVLQQLAERLEADGVLTDKNAYLEAVRAREEQGSTAIGFDVSIPHGKSEGVAHSAVAFARLPQPIDWSGSGDMTRLVFLIAVPKEQEGTEHLQILAALSRKLMHAGFREELKGAATPEDVLHVLEG